MGVVSVKGGSCGCGQCEREDHVGVVCVKGGSCGCGLF